MSKQNIKGFHRFNKDGQDIATNEYTGDFIREVQFETSDAIYLITFYSKKVFRLIKITDTILYANATDIGIAADRNDFERISPDFESFMRSQIRFVYQDDPF